MKNDTHKTKIMRRTTVNAQQHRLRMYSQTVTSAAVSVVQKFWWPAENLPIVMPRNVQEDWATSQNWHINRFAAVFIFHMSMFCNGSRVFFFFFLLFFLRFLNRLMAMISVYLWSSEAILYPLLLFLSYNIWQASFCSGRKKFSHLRLHLTLVRR